MGRSRTVFVVAFFAVCVGVLSALAISCSQSGGCLEFCGPASYDMSQGGDCQVTVTFSDGTTATVDASWGPRTDSCCGTAYARAPQATFPPDGAGLSGRRRPRRRARRVRLGSRDFLCAKGGT